MAKISVIIPVYNTAKFLDECVTTVINQTFKELEILLVDDGSTDGVSPKMCDDYAARDSRVKVIHKENGGLISAWTEGVIEATSDYVAFVDSDDWIDLDMMEKLYERTDTSFAKSEIISGNYIVEKAGERRKETQSLKPGEYKGEALNELKQKILGEEIRPVTMSRCMKLISRQLVLENMKYCDPSITMSEDVNIMLPCLCDVKRLVILEGAYFYHYRLVATSMAHGYTPKLLTNLQLTDKTFREILREKNISNADQQMDREFVMMLMVIMKNALRSENTDTVKMVKDIFLREDIRKKILDTRVDISGKAGKLMYFTARHPNAATISFARAVIRTYDKKTN